MLWAIRAVAGAFSATALFWAGVAWENRPAGWPSYRLALGPFHKTFSLPDGPGARYRALRAELAGWAGALGQCQADARALAAAVDRQSAAAARLARVGRARLADARTAVAEAQAGGGRAADAAETILDRPPASADTCSRVLEVDRALLEALS